jgi:fibronectin-binding autotransporter adhesin
VGNLSTLVASNNNALGGGSAATTVSSGGALALAGGISTAENITISGAGGTGTPGALRNVNGSNTNTGTITLAANATISADTATTLQLNNINNNSGALTVSNVGTVLVTGTMSNTDTNSTFFKLGTGSLVFSNSAAGYNGASQMQMAGGVFTLAAGTFSTNTSTVRRSVDFGLNPDNSGSSLSTAFYVNQGVTMSNSIYVAGGGGARILGTESTNGTATFNNEIYLDSTVRLTAASGGTARFSGNFVNTGGLTKVGDGIVILAGTNINSGAVTISNGTLAVTNGGAINNSVLVTIDNGATLSVLGSETVGQFTGNGSVSVATGQVFRSRYDSASNSFAGTITGSGEFLKGGTGTLTLSGANNFAGEMTHEAGVLLVGNNSALGSFRYLVDFSNATNKTIAANGTANFTLSQSNRIFNNLTLGEATGNTGKLTFAGGTFLGDEIGETRTLTVAANNNHEFSGGITGNRGIIKAGTGTLTLSGNNTFGNTFQLNEGTVLVGNNNAFGAGFVQVQFDIAGTKTIASASSTGYTITNNVNVFNDLNLGLASVNTGSLNFSGTFYLGDEIGQNRFITTAAGTGHTVSGAVTGNRGIVKRGAGTITLSGANTSSGGFFIDGGTLNLNGGSIAFSGIEIGGGVNGNPEAGDSAALRVTSGTFNQAITVNGNTNASGVAGSRAIEFANATGSATLSGGITAEKTFTANVANSAATGVLSGIISNDGGLTKTGDGTLTLSGASANTYTGLTTVSAGTLNLNKSSGNAIAGATTISSGAVLLLSASNQVDSGAGDTITLSGGTIRRGGANVSEAFGNLNITAASTLDFGTGGLSSGSYEFRFETYSNTGSALVTVQNFLPGTRLQFLSASFNAGNLTSFNFDNGYNTSIDGSYFTITAIPEPSTYAAAVGLLALFLWPVRRRLIKDAKSILGLRPSGRDRIEAYRA